MTYHPHLDSENNRVFIKNPSTPSHSSSWPDPSQVACFTPGCETGDHFHPVHPDWNTHEVGYDDSHIPFHNSPGFHSASGLVMVEPDMRVWGVVPTNHYGGYTFTFPKGAVDLHEPLVKAAVRETHEETGLLGKPITHLGDYKRSTSKARMYVANRIGGCPSHMGWESQAVKLVPLADLHNHVHTDVDRQIVRDLHNYFKNKAINESIRRLL